MLNIGIISEGHHQQLYFLIRSIRKNFAGNYTIHLFSSQENMLYNKVDNLIKHDNIEDPYTWMVTTFNEDVMILHEDCMLMNKVNLDEYDYERGVSIGPDMYYFHKTFPLGTQEQWRKKLSQEVVPMVVTWDGNSNYIGWLYENDTCWKFDYYDLIVGMTNWSGRINHEAFYECLDRLLKQKCKYNFKIVISLSEQELGRKIPDRLAKYESEDFEILWSWENTRPLKKYDPINAKYPELPLMILDDDDMCDEDAVEYMYETHLKDPWSAYGTEIEPGPGLCKWIADLRIWPPHCMYPLPIDDYYTFFSGIMDDNFNQIRCLFKMTPVRAAIPHSHKRNDDFNTVLSLEYQNFDYDYAYCGIIDAHKDELPEELYYD